MGGDKMVMKHQKSLRRQMREGGKDELAERMCMHIVDHSFWQLPDSDQRSEHIEFNNPRASSTFANGENTVETCGAVLY
jgi:hypothetical protein